MNFGDGIVVMELFLLWYCDDSYFKPENAIKASFKELYDDDRKNKIKYSLSYILTYLCDEMNLNNPDIEGEYNKLKDYFKPKDNKVFGAWFRHSTPLLTASDMSLLSERADKLFKKIDLLATQNKNFGSLGENAKLNIIINLKKYCIRWDEEPHFFKRH